MIRPVDVIGYLPRIAARELAKRISVARLGSITIDVLNLEDQGGPTTSERQLSSGCGGLVIFFTRYDLSGRKTINELDVMERLFAEGVVMQHGKQVLYMGSFVDPRRDKVNWIEMPLHVKDWYKG